MMPMTPSGTRTRSMVMPFGRVQRSVTAPTGSAQRAHHVEAVRHGGDALVVERQPVEEGRRSRPTPWRSAMSSALAARIAALRARIASAIAASALSFCAAGASASARAAASRARPDVVHQAGESAVLSMVLSGAVMAAIRRSRAFLSCSPGGREAGSAVGLPSALRRVMTPASSTKGYSHEAQGSGRDRHRRRPQYRRGDRQAVRRRGRQGRGRRPRQAARRARRRRDQGGRAARPSCSSPTSRRAATWRRW